MDGGTTEAQNVPHKVPQPTRKARMEASRRLKQVPGEGILKVNMDIDDVVQLIENINM